MAKNYDKVLELFRIWLDKAIEDEAVREELKALNEKLHSPKAPVVQEALDEIYEAFYKDLEFGTGGLRGILGAGTNRMNIYTVGKTTQGLANYIKLHDSQNPSVAISYDSRINSKLFANAAAKIMTANDISVYIFPELAPTPMLSYAVRYFKASAGMMITASHNPSIYNGCKVYNEEGCQMTTEASDEVLSFIGHIDEFEDVKFCDCNEELIKEIGSDMGNSYTQDVLRSGAQKECDNAKPCYTPLKCDNLQVVYTPLNGAGLKPVLRILEEIGVGKVHVVKSQEQPDGNFPTCPYPNPEKREALEEGLKLCRSLKTPDLLIATDPDGDRIGIAVLCQEDKDEAQKLSEGEKDYKLLAGNEVGVLLLDFLCKTKEKPQNPIAIKTIVTSNMVKDVCKEHNLEMREVLTGFKYIGEIIGQLERMGEEKRFFFGFEESYGYLSGSYVRDKDSVNGAMLVCQMASYYKAQGLTLCDRLTQLYEKYGYYVDRVSEFAFEGAAGMEMMARIMRALRSAAPSHFGGCPLEETTDYMDENTGLPKSEVIRFIMQNGASLTVRPSGTEPKLKVYASAKGCTPEESMDIIRKMQEEISMFVEKSKK
ncbi:MAG: phospho-sugar mutase [Clostridia bacterium]|nr:phospho-sugar mutase [Clostridia bacterium]